MLLADHFAFQAPDDIRLKGTRGGIETVRYAFIVHPSAGRHVPDGFVPNAGMTHGETIEVLQLNASATGPGEHRDQIKHLSKR